MTGASQSLIMTLSAVFYVSQYSEVCLGLSLNIMQLFTSNLVVLIVESNQIVVESLSFFPGSNITNDYQ